MKESQPNVILINCDDLGYGDLSCYGSTLNRTPHIDALAADGLRLTDFYMASPVCSASRAAMMTGCYPPRVGFGERPVLFPGMPYGLNPDEKTVASYLKDAGYATKIVGKWHCGDQEAFLPTSHGFDEYFGLPYSNDMGRQADRLESPPLPLLRDKTVIQQQPDQRGLTERYTDECLQFINANQEQPFFLYLAHMYVHLPLFVPKQFLDRSKNGAYGGAVECIDWSVGVLVDQLRKLNLLDNTLIIFTSDNGSRARDGGGSNAPCRGTKATTLEGGQRVPCIFHWPAEITPNQTNASIASSIDLLPTLCGLAGVDVADERSIDGVDLGNFLRGESESSGRDSFFYFTGRALQAVRVGDWKLRVDGSSIWSKAPSEPIAELYNLKDDVGETHNCYDSRPEVVQELSAAMTAMAEELGDRLTGVVGFGERASGYIEDAKPLTEYDPEHPYMIAMYDLLDMPTLSG
ncbi:sulfatase [Coraliomargarita sp. SDUM461004]|uniref:Sulfatase n=1 Tax=Thalassobacterium sedimentorum TaxID=3041258 RepID=A0ABU1ADP0_9BACT|nr:sulfatase [Coraliomargarita sp. SDUM461004]MDQ8192807.1 sulfatase [Coraliomargarita sp. SDUM461004]